MARKFVALPCMADTKILWEHSQILDRPTVETEVGIDRTAKLEKRTLVQESEMHLRYNLCYNQYGGQGADAGVFTAEKRA